MKLGRDRLKALCAAGFMLLAFLLALHHLRETSRADPIQELIGRLQFHQRPSEKLHRWAHQEFPGLAAKLLAPPPNLLNESIAAAQTLRLMGEPAIAPLAAALNHPEPYARIQVLLTLKNIGLHHPLVWDSFLGACKDEDEQIRTMAAHMLLSYFLREGKGTKEELDTAWGSICEPAREIITTAALVYLSRGWNSDSVFYEIRALTKPGLEDKNDWGGVAAGVELAADLGQEAVTKFLAEMVSDLLQGEKRPLVNLPGSMLAQMTFPAPGGALMIYEMSYYPTSMADDLLARLTAILRRMDMELEAGPTPPESIQDHRLAKRAQAARVAFEVNGDLAPFETIFLAVLDAGNPVLSAWAAQVLPPSVWDNSTLRFRLENLVKSHPDHNLRAMAASALGNITAPGSRTLEILKRALQDDWVYVRAAAVEALGRNGSEARDEILPLLLEALESSSGLVRASAAGALWRLGHPPEELRPVLEDCLEHQLKSVRSRAIQVMQEMETVSSSF
jgi:hypothetical protein